MLAPVLAGLGALALMSNPRRRRKRAKRRNPGPNKTWTLWSLDVWGNARDGFEVNDRGKVNSDLYIADESDKGVIAALKAGGYIDAHVKPSQIDVDDGGSADTLYINQKRNGRPVYQLERNDRKQTEHRINPRRRRRRK